MVKEKVIGFIGGGRAAYILLGSLKRADEMPSQVIVSDVNSSALERLKPLFPEITTALNANRKAATAEIVFLAVHPPVIPAVLSEIKEVLNRNAVLFSIAPKVTMAKLRDGLNGFDRIIRMIPNACSIVNAGYNPLCFSPAFSAEEKQELLRWLSVLGECPEVSEEKLEAYAVLTAMGPTYLWFQLAELTTIGQSLGLTADEISKGLKAMVIGAVKTLFESGLSVDEVMDLIPAKPLKDREEEIRSIYREVLPSWFERLKSA